MPTNDAANVKLLSIADRCLTCEIAGTRHEVLIVEGDREAEPAAYFCPATATGYRYVSGPLAGQQVTPPAVIAALESIDEDALTAALCDLWYDPEHPAITLYPVVAREAA